MKWEVCVSTECSIGGGEEINGFEDGGPPTLCQPASQQGAERRWKPGRRSLEGVGGALGHWGKFLVSFSLPSRSLLLFTCEPGIGRPDQRLCTSFWPSWTGGDILDESESFIFVIFSLCVFYCQCLIRSGWRKYSRINLWKNILKPLKSSKDLVGSLCYRKR